MLQHSDSCATPWEISFDHTHYIQLIYSVEQHNRKQATWNFILDVLQMRTTCRCPLLHLSQLLSEEKRQYFTHFNRLQSLLLSRSRKYCKRTKTNKLKSPCDGLTMFAMNAKKNLH